MHKQIVFTTLAIMLFVGGLIGAAIAQNNQNDDDAKEGTIKLSDAPKAVQAAIAELTGGHNIKHVSKENEDGATTYEVEYVDNGAESEAELSETGEILEITTSLNANALPPTLAQAIKKAYPNGTVKEAESVQAFYYEAEVMVDGKLREITVSVSGEVDEDDDD